MQNRKTKGRVVHSSTFWNFVLWKHTIKIKNFYTEYLWEWKGVCTTFTSTLRALKSYSPKNKPETVQQIISVYNPNNTNKINTYIPNLTIF